MERGEVGIKEISKVIDYIATLDDAELRKRMMESPQKAMARMQTAVDRLFIELNDAGVLDMMTAVLDALADSVKVLTSGFKVIKPILSDIWSVVKPMLTLWATVWGVKKIYQLAAAMRVLAVSVGLVSAAGSGGLLGGKVGGLGRISKLIGKVGLLKTTMLLLNRAWLVFGGIVKKSFLAVGILALIDMLETLQGKRTVLTELMGGDGIIATGAKILVGAFRTMQMLMELVIAGFHGFFTGDWGFFKDSWDRWKESMNSLFPFDEWAEGFRTFLSRAMTELAEFGKVMWGVGKFATNPMNPINAVSAYDAIQNYTARSERQGIPTKSATNYVANNPLNSSGSVPTTFHFSPLVTIQGSGLSEPQLESVINNVLDKQMTKAKANYVQRY